MLLASLLSRSSLRFVVISATTTARALPPSASRRLLRRNSGTASVPIPLSSPPPRPFVKIMGGQGGKIGSTNPSAATGMEVEVKLRLPSKQAHDAVAAALGRANKGGPLATHQQENFFLDGPGKELSSRMAVLRIRFYDVDRRALVTLKGKQKLVDGIGRGTEVEFDFLDAKAARKFVSPAESSSKPSSAFLDEAPQDNPVLRSLREDYEAKELVCIGGFRNVRKEFAFEGHTLELDETRFDHGTVYEIEVESADPERVKEKLEAFLRENGIEFEYSATTKFANFINKTLL